MSDEQRIFLDEKPPATAPRGPWLGAALVGLVLIGTALLLTDRRPDSNRDLVELPAPDVTTTTSSSVATTTSTSQPLADLNRLVPSFDHTLRLVYIEDSGIRIGTWRPTGAPAYTDHAIGRPEWVGFDAAAVFLAAVSSNSNGERVLWVGSAEMLHPVRIEDQLLSAGFHTHIPASLAVAVADEEETVISLLDVTTSGTTTVRDELIVAGAQFLISWTDAGLILFDQNAETPLSLVDETGQVTPLRDKFAIYSSGAPLLVPGLRAEPVVTIDDGEMIELPTGTVSLSPNRVFAVTDSTFEQRLIDLESGLDLPLTDSVGFPHDWSIDNRWFVYISAIESFRQGTLNRFVFVDAMAGSSVTAAIATRDIQAPHLLFVGP